MNCRLGVSENKDVLFFLLKGPMRSIHSLLRYFRKAVLIGIRIPKSSVLKDTWNMLCWTSKTSSFIAELLRSSRLFWISKGTVFKQLYQGTRALVKPGCTWGKILGGNSLGSCSVTQPSGDIEEFHPLAEGTLVPLQRFWIKIYAFLKCSVHPVGKAVCTFANPGPAAGESALWEWFRFLFKIYWGHIG